MSYIRDPLVLWAIGALSLAFSIVSSLIAGSVVGIPMALIGAALGYSQENVLLVLAYTAVVWLPLGFGMGMATAVKFLKGYRVRNPKGD
ncbi:hypothetical protein [Altererythrobacter sp. MF3-039]|uniref:hypothetical protein n=1 Tax=Altererythrobacter sp. MF3-039 TaxID=3252901 RepID=UPI00390C6D9E